MKDFDPAAFIDAYRKAWAQHEASPSAEAEATVYRMRGQWAAWQGEDSLHEMAFGEPENEDLDP